MRLELTEEEAGILREVLRTHLGDLSAEIANTDNPAFRRALRNRRDRLARVHTALGEAPAVTSSS
ncbi:hypothetical protein [Amycolatopsis pigmentata]|uniref:50S ribosomal protein L29 n=1 Tax=Amycolatopsis pigmentata TaxID=450801 RepID=A0ABW5FRZ1_9PSEU